MKIIASIKKLKDDTLKTGGKYSIKRVAGVSGFYVAIVYAFTPLLAPEFEIHEFVFWGFITFAATAILGTVWNKKIDKPNLINGNENRSDQVP